MLDGERSSASRNVRKETLLPDPKTLSLSLSPSPWRLQSLLGCPHPDQIGKSPSCCCVSVAGIQPLCHSGLRPSDSNSAERRRSSPLFTWYVSIPLQPSDTGQTGNERSRPCSQSLVLEAELAATATPLFWLTSSILLTFPS